MVQIVRHKMTRHDDARSLLRAIYSTEVEILRDPQAKTLTIRLHPLARRALLQMPRYDPESAAVRKRAAGFAAFVFDQQPLTANGLRCVWRVDERRPSLVEAHAPLFLLQRGHLRVPPHRRSDPIDSHSAAVTAISTPNSGEPGTA